MATLAQPLKGEAMKPTELEKRMREKYTARMPLKDDHIQVALVVGSTTYFADVCAAHVANALQDQLARALAKIVLKEQAEVKSEPEFDTVDDSGLA